MQMSSPRRAVELVVALSAVVVMAGCTVEQTGGSDTWGVGPGADAAGDTADGGTSDGGTGDGGVEGTRTTFRLVNEREGAVWLAESGPCGPDEPGWASLSRRGGGELRIEASCGICDCRELRESGSCAVCGAAPCREQGEFRKLAGGESVEWTWDGRYWSNGTVDGRTCEERDRVAPESELEVEMCWQTGRRTGSAECETLEFAAGTDEVTHRLSEDGSSGPSPTTFRLHNDSESPAWVNTRGICSRDPSWLSVSDPEGGFQVASDCRTCECSEVESGACNGGCAVRCAEPSAAKLEPGETRELEWDGVGYRTAERNGQTCHEREVPPAGREMTATFCTIPGPTAFGTPDCSDVDFAYGETETVDYHIGGGGGGSAETTFRLVNDSDATVQLYRPNPCTGGERAWIGLQDGTTPVDFSSDCTTCRCDEAESGVCGRCDRACLDEQTELKPGESVEKTWDGQGFRRNQVDSTTCHESWKASSGEQMTARFCFVPADHSSSTPECRTQGFRFGRDDTVVEQL